MVTHSVAANTPAVLACALPRRRALLRLLEVVRLVRHLLDGASDGAEPKVSTSQAEKSRIV